MQRKPSRVFLGLALWFCAPLFAVSPVLADAAILQGLDKITARISTFEAPLDTPVRFGSLSIIARTCYKRPPEEPPESTAFLEVVVVHPDSEPVSLFTGWMFASSPAISAIEHPVYDVWVIDCAAASSQGAEGEDPEGPLLPDIVETVPLDEAAGENDVTQ